MGASGGFTASFVVGNGVTPGAYVITVSSGSAPNLYVYFSVVQPFIQLSDPLAVGQPASGPIGRHVNIEGSYFSLGDTTCSISAPTNGAILATYYACATFAGTGIFTGYNNVTGSFVVGNVPEGQYVIQVTGSTGDYAQAVFNVTAGAFIQLSGASGGFVSVGQVASGTIGTHVNIEGSQFLPNDVFNTPPTCTLSGPTNAAIILNGACSFFKTPTGSVNVTGSFNVGNIAPGQYVIQVYGTAGDYAQAIFNVIAGGPFIQLKINSVVYSVGQTASAVVGMAVNVEGSHFMPTDSVCYVSSPTSAVVVGGACSVFIPTSGSFTAFTNVTASFTVGSVSPGQYVITVTGNQGDYAQALLNVTSGPFIQLKINSVVYSVGQTASALVGMHVSFEGSHFVSTDSVCYVSGPASAVVQVGACSVFIPTSGSFTGFANVTGSFSVGFVSPGQYVVQVTGNQGDYARAILNVTSGPFIQLSIGRPNGFFSVGQITSGPTGTSVTIEGSHFVSTDSICYVTGPASAIVAAAACSVFLPTSGSFTGFANVTASFTVGSVAPGQYVVQVTGNQGDYAQALFNVTLGPKIALSPATVPPGHSVIVNGTGFLPFDGTCTISSPSPNVVEYGSAACVTRLGTGVVSGSFILGNVLPGQYIVQVTGNYGDWAQAVLNVTAGPKLTLSPGTGMIGTSILVNGTGFLTTDQSCSISSISSPNPILVGSSACATTVGTGIVRGSFIIGAVSPGEYVIEITGCAGNNGCAPSVGDFAQDVLTVTQAAPTLTLFPTNSSEESTVTYIGTGLSPSDTGCTLLSYNSNTGLVDDNLITSPTCSVTSHGVAQGTFVVSPYATTNIPWLLTVRGTPQLDQTPFAVFNVTADLIVTPTSGTVNTVFTYTGSGFSGTAEICTAAIAPPFPALPYAGPFGESATNAGCYVSAGTGQVSGSVTVPTDASQGTYGIVVTAVNATGYANSATGFFTVGTPSALVVLNPATVGQGQPVGVAGFGFNPSDAWCIITTDGAAEAGTQECSISGGYASGSFTVSPTAVGGYYLITIIACSMSTSSSATTCSGSTLDFASNFLGVTLATTVTEASTTTTTSSSTTSFSTTTTSMVTSFSYSSTTYSTTGILFTTYTQFTESTVSGMTTTTYTQTTSSTQTQTTVTFSTTTSFTTVPCPGMLPCGLTIQPAPMNPAPGIDSVALLAAVLLLLPMLFRRLFT
jgi:hypothetical protein